MIDLLSSFPLGKVSNLVCFDMRTDWDSLVFGPFQHELSVPLQDWEGHNEGRSDHFREITRRRISHSSCRIHTEQREIRSKAENFTFFFFLHSPPSFLSSFLQSVWICFTWTVCVELENLDLVFWECWKNVFIFRCGSLKLRILHLFGWCSKGLIISLNVCTKMSEQMTMALNLQVRPSRRRRRWWIRTWTISWRSLRPQETKDSKSQFDKGFLHPFSGLCAWTMLLLVVVVC